MTTLKLIQDSPGDCHTQTGELIAGDPDVGTVRYKGNNMAFSRLPSAGSEAATIARLLGVRPLLGEKATKQMVLDRLHSVSLLHLQPMVMPTEEKLPSLRYALLTGLLIMKKKITFDDV